MMGGIMAWADAITGYHPQSSALAAVCAGRTQISGLIGWCGITIGALERVFLDGPWKRGLRKAEGAFT